MSKIEEQSKQQIQSHRNFTTICNTHAEEAEQKRSQAERKGLKFQGMLECLAPLIQAIDERLDNHLAQEQLNGPVIVEARAIRGLCEQLRMQALEHGNKASGEAAALSVLCESYKKEALAHEANIQGLEMQFERARELEKNKEATAKRKSNDAKKAKKSARSPP